MRSRPGSPRTGWLARTGRRLWEGTRDLGWFSLVLLVPVAVCIGSASYLLWLGVDGARAQYAGVAGTVSVEDCQWQQARRGGGWECTGNFRSDDGTVQIDLVTVNPWLDEWPEEPVAARVSGASASRARAQAQPYQWVQHLLAGAALAGMAVWLGHSLVSRAEGDARRRRRWGWGVTSPVAGASPVTGHTELANLLASVAAVPARPEVRAPEPTAPPATRQAASPGRSLPVRVVAAWPGRSG